MMNRRKKHISIKLIILLICLIIFILFVLNALSRYQTSSRSIGDIEVAYYLLNADYQTADINLFSIIPRQEPYVKNFSVSNNNGTTRTETSLEYDLSITVTTNLPLRYELYLNQNYTSSGATNIITRNVIEPDEYGTYFGKFGTDTEKFGHKNNETNMYQLVIYFPEQYRLVEYQDIMENIEVTVNSRQIIE